MPADVELSPSDVVNATVRGCARQFYALLRGRRDKFPLHASGLRLHVDGAGAENAFAVWLGVDLPPLTDALDSKTGDVAGYQVRSTTHDRGCLIVYPHDPQGVYVLVVGSLPRFRICGWTTARDGRQPQFWRNDPGVGKASHWIPQPVLRPLVDLPDVPE
jgi:hypothetical protein